VISENSEATEKRVQIGAEGRNMLCFRLAPYDVNNFT